MDKYKLKIPEEFYALQWTGDNFEEIISILIDKNGRKPTNIDIQHEKQLRICCDEGLYRLVIGDYILLQEHLEHTGFYEFYGCIKDLSLYEKT